MKIFIRQLAIIVYVLIMVSETYFNLFHKNNYVKNVIICLPKFSLSKMKICENL